MSSWVILVLFQRLEKSSSTDGPKIVKRLSDSKKIASKASNHDVVDAGAGVIFLFLFLSVKILNE